VEVDLFGEGAEEREDVDDGGSLGRELRFVEVGSELGRGREIEREGDVLADVEAAVVEVMLVDVVAELIAGVAGGFGGGEGLVDVGADVGADGGGGVEAGVIAAGIEGGGYLEERLAVLERDGGATLLNARGTRTEGGVLLLGHLAWWRGRVWSRGGGRGGRALGESGEGESEGEESESSRGERGETRDHDRGSTHGTSLWKRVQGAQCGGNCGWLMLFYGAVRERLKPCGLEVDRGRWV
jgi:hypothetical protein